MNIIFWSLTHLSFHFTCKCFLIQANCYFEVHKLRKNRHYSSNRDLKCVWLWRWGKRFSPHYLATVAMRLLSGICLITSFAIKKKKNPSIPGVNFLWSCWINYSCWILLNILFEMLIFRYWIELFSFVFFGVLFTSGFGGLNEWIGQFSISYALELFNPQESSDPWHWGGTCLREWVIFMVVRNGKTSDTLFIYFCGHYSTRMYNLGMS